MVRVACIGIGAHTGFVMEQSADRLRSEGYDIELVLGDSVTLDEDLDQLYDYLDDVSTCDFIFISAHGDVSYFRHWHNLRKVIEKNRISGIVYGYDESTSPEMRSLFLQSQDDYNLLYRLETIGGDENHRSALLWMLKTFGGADIEVPEPVVPMAQGIYIPGEGARTLDEGLKDVGSTGRPVILILFVNVYFLRHNTASIDCLCEKVREVGGEPVALFLKSYEDPLTGSIGIARIIDEYLVRGGRPIVDAVINTMGFAMTLTSKPGSGEQVPDDNFFERLNVPILQAINLYGSAKEWQISIISRSIK